MARNPAHLDWKKSGSGYLPPLPNSDSEFTTATTKIIDIHYSNKRVAERWTFERYERLCSFLKLTHYELASLVCMPHSYVEKIRDFNRIPGITTGGGRAIGMLLTLLEARVMKKIVSDVIVNPFPNLNNTLKHR